MLRIGILLLALLAACPLHGGAQEQTTSTVSLRSLGYDDVQLTTRMNFDVEYRRAEEPWVEDIVARASAARSVVNRATGDALMSRIRVIVAPDRQTFLRLVGGWAEHSAAVAVPSERTMIINGDVMRQGAPGNLGTTLVHELVHLYFGVSSPRPLPRWLDEGLAQLIANEGTAEAIATLTWARWLRGLIPLEQLERSFPMDPNRQKLAYQQSLSVAQFLLKEKHGGSVSSFVGSVTGPGSRDQIAEYWDPVIRDALQLRWTRSLGAGGNWVTLTLSSGLFWGAAAGLTILAWFLIRRRNRSLRQEWDEEEKIYEALDEEERRIYGDDDEDLVYRDEYELGSLEDWEDGTDRKK